MSDSWRVALWLEASDQEDLWAEQNTHSHAPPNLNQNLVTTMLSQLSVQEVRKGMTDEATFKKGRKHPADYLDLCSQDKVQTHPPYTHTICIIKRVLILGFTLFIMQWAQSV